MDDDWSTNPGPVQTQTYTNTNQNQSNWRDSNREHRGGFRGGNRGFRGGSRGPPRSGGFQSGQNGSDDATLIKIPSNVVGLVIGKGGSKIRELQADSGANINVTKETEGDETIVKLFGSQDAISKATELINSLVSGRESRSNNSHNSWTENASSRSNNSHNSWTENAPSRPNGSYNSWTESAPSKPSDSHNSWTENTPVTSTNEPVSDQPKQVDWRAIFQKSDEMEAARWAALPAIQKQFYTEHPDVTALTQEEVEAFRADNNNIVVERTFKKEDSKPVPKPVLRFEHAFHNYPEILCEIEKAGFTTPSPIQSQAWPVLLSGEDLIGIAQTGTGKTLAFLLPAMIHIDGQLIKRPERQGPAVLIMAPTRELALQIEKETRKYEYRGITALCVYGGGNRREQIKVLTDGVDIVIATPGRLNDLSEAGHLDVQYVTYVVLDEADRMLDMGFEPQIRKVMYSIRPTRQTVMTSATWPPGVRRLAQSYMDDPIQVYVGTLDLAATHTVTQIIEILPDSDEEKYNTFMEFIRNLDPSEKVIVFCGKKCRADQLSTDLVLAGINCQAIHGDRDQSDREQALVDISNGTVQILIATDVASRGLDIDDITHVINYDFPRNIEEYVHRVGRTGRAGKTGKSISYITRGDWAQAKDLINILEEAQQYIPEELFQMAERYSVWKEKKDASRPSGRGRGGGQRRW